MVADSNTEISPEGKLAANAAASRGSRSETYGGARDEYAAIRELRQKNWIAAHIRERRFELDLTQKDVADRAETSHSFISKVERGDHLPTIAVLERILAVFDEELLIGIERRIPNDEAGSDATAARVHPPLPRPDSRIPRPTGRMRDRDTAINARGRELVELASGYFPQELEVTGDGDAWPLVGAAMVSRMVGTMKAILAQHPSELETDAGADVRRLFEQAVYMAWLAAEPSAERIQAWRKTDLRSRLTADDDARAHGVQLLTDEQRAALEAQVARLDGGRLVLESVAKEADEHWAGRLPGMGGKGEIKSWRGFYAIVYRNYSGFTHPTFRGLNPVVVDLSPTRRKVRLEEPYEGNGPYGMATVIFGLSLLIVAEALGWPSPGGVEAIFERHP